MQMTPRKLHVELTTQCNLRCAMCVKHSAGWECADAHMTRQTFEALAPLFPHLDTLNLNGVGESLLHPELPALLAFAREKTSRDCIIGLQSNGMPLTPFLASALVDAGLDRICFSVDSPDPSQLERFRAGSDLDRVAHAFGHMNAARRGARALTLGAQTVIHAQNYESLPGMVAWCAEQGASFVIVSNALPYNAQDAGQSLYESVSRRSLDFYGEWKKVFRAEGLDASHSYRAFYAVFRTPEQQRLVEIMLAMIADARSRGLQFSLPGVMLVDEARVERVREVFARGAHAAASRGVRLELPEMAASEPRQCPFVQSPSLFVACDGSLTPCYFLWHSYTAWPAGREVRVRQRRFGQVPADDPLAVWRSPAFSRFRAEAEAGEYARCGDCSVAPCDHVQGFPHPFAQDCYDQAVPCGICPWSGGGFACLH